MARKDRTGNRKTREERMVRRIPELGYYLVITDTDLILQKKIGIHFYVNIANLDDVSEAEEKATNEVRHVYDMDRLKRMYDYLSKHGSCYYIQYQGQLVGDATLRDNAEICIVVSKGYQNRHIGRRCVLNLLALAKEKGMKEVKANIYAFNTQSQKMFESVGFRQTEEEWYSFLLPEN